MTSWSSASTCDAMDDIDTHPDTHSDGTVSWLTKDDIVLASLEQPAGRVGRARGLLGRNCFDGALVLTGTRSVHTVGMRFTIDVAICDPDLRVRRILTLVPWRITRPEFRATTIIEVPGGAFEQWGVRVGDQLAVR